MAMMAMRRPRWRSGARSRVVGFAKEGDGDRVVGASTSEDVLELDIESYR